MPILSVIFNFCPFEYSVLILNQNSLDSFLGNSSNELSDFLFSFFKDKASISQAALNLPR